MTVKRIYCGCEIVIIDATVSSQQITILNGMGVTGIIEGQVSSSCQVNALQNTVD